MQKLNFPYLNSLDWQYRDDNYPCISFTSQNDDLYLVLAYVNWKKGFFNPVFGRLLQLTVADKKTSAKAIFDTDDFPKLDNLYNNLVLEVQAKEKELKECLDL